MWKYFHKSFDKFTDQLVIYICYFIYKGNMFLLTNDLFIDAILSTKVLCLKIVFWVFFCFSFLFTGITLCISSILYTVIIYF